MAKEINAIYFGLVENKLMPAGEKQSGLTKEAKLNLVSRYSGVIFAFLLFVFHVLPLLKGIAPGMQPKMMFYIIHLVLVGVLGWMLIGNLASVTGMYAVVVFFQGVMITMKTMLDSSLYLFFLGGSLILFCRTRRIKSYNCSGVSWCFLVLAVAYAVPALVGDWSEGWRNYYWVLQAMAGGVLVTTFSSWEATHDLKMVLLSTSAVALTFVGLLSMVAAWSGGYLGDLLLLNGETRLGCLDIVGGNSFAYLMASGSLMWLALWGQGGNTLISLAGCATCFVIMLLTKTMSVGVLYVIAIILGLYWARHPYKRLLLTLLVTSFVGVGIWTADSLKNISFFFNAEQKHYSTLSARTEIWETVIPLVPVYPFGISAKNYETLPVISRTYVSVRDGADEFVLTPHNSVLGAFIFGGFAGGVAFLTMHILLLLRALRGLRADPYSRLFILIPIFGIAAHFMIDIWYFAYYWILAWLAFSMAPDEVPEKLLQSGRSFS